MGIAWDMWQHWNKALHREPNNQALILDAEINIHITELYSLGPGAFSLSMALMKHFLPELVQLPQGCKAHWIDSVQIAKECKDRLKARPYHQECQYMQT